MFLFFTKTFGPSTIHVIFRPPGEIHDPGSASRGLRAICYWASNDDNSAIALFHLLTSGTQHDSLSVIYIDLMVWFCPRMATCTNPSLLNFSKTPLTHERKYPLPPVRRCPTHTSCVLTKGTVYFHVFPSLQASSE